jgi:hypothetical protein
MTAASPPPTDLKTALEQMRASLAAAQETGLARMLQEAILGLLTRLVTLVADFRAGRLVAPAPVVEPAATDVDCAGAAARRPDGPVAPRPSWTAGGILGSAWTRWWQSDAREPAGRVRGPTRRCAGKRDSGIIGAPAPPPPRPSPVKGEGEVARERRRERGTISRPRAQWRDTPGMRRAFPPCARGTTAAIGAIFKKPALRVRDRRAHFCSIT